jgi:hypothetical protein
MNATCSMHGKIRSVYEISDIKPHPYVQTGKDNTKMDLKETGCEDVDWIQSAKDMGQLTW